jgi:hypothetical protein
MMVLSYSVHLKGFMGEETEGYWLSANILDRLNGSMQNIEYPIRQPI